MLPEKPKHAMNWTNVVYLYDSLLNHMKEVDGRPALRELMGLITNDLIEEFRGKHPKERE